MQYYVVIPAHNEEAHLRGTLNSLCSQKLKPKKIVVVNDNSTDDTEKIIDHFITRNPGIEKVNTQSSNLHLPGSKVINAFNAGLKLLDEEYDFIVKLDADVILPVNYFEEISHVFKNDKEVGVAGGFIYEEDKEGEWKLNHPMSRNHVRGAIKAYSKNCFKAIGGLKNAMGWDTIDELLAQYHGFRIVTIDELHVKHLRPLGRAYNKKARLLQGMAMYQMRYGFLITVIASLKMAWKLKDPLLFLLNMQGFFKAYDVKAPFLVSPDEGAFTRALRWRNIRAKLF
ncbi:glycosyltransferase family 2 protein [Zeaxanthinibacter sp. PT1]|uniref:glycosyltransferase n=1 Tax=Zeaxanthinibacter TaxID=561554 RepID=UPI002349517D|nr:glycosyltransferase family 2 protein [Zeaxanthinibacter sp. PT1]MDC6352669.1 glycosyltransferase family 2 protein [Zeaxanthinibacter sp. PT1]